MDGLKNIVILAVSLYMLKYVPALFFIGVAIVIINWLLTNVVNEQKADAILNAPDKKNDKNGDYNNSQKY